jgi:hypothetical protein
MVEKLDFLTSFGHGDGGDSRVTSVHPGVTRDKIQGATGWPIRFADELAETPAPSSNELEVFATSESRDGRSASVVSAFRRTDSRMHRFKDSWIGRLGIRRFDDQGFTMRD